ncbi:MAG: cation:proton antiporter [Micrococcales bacterium]|nr:cation:proton antiporter [Micrococcales bacterium]
MLDAMPSLLESLFAVAVVAGIAPMITALLPGPSMPQVVFLILGGILIGPEAFNWASPDQIEALSQLGLGFLFLMAGYELEMRLFSQLPGKLAIRSWFVTAGLALAFVLIVQQLRVIDGSVEVTIALTTTALGTLLPILRENGTLNTALGPFVFAAGAVGEFLPIVAMALLLSATGAIGGIIALVAMGIAVFMVLQVLMRARRRGVAIRLSLQEHATGQITLRWTVILLVFLLMLAEDFGLDIVLGGFLAGVVLRRWAPGDTDSLERKLEAVSWGLFIPIFFINSGMTLDIASILAAPWEPVGFAVLMLVIRGLPALYMYRDVLTINQRWQMVFYTATALPLLVALSQVGQEAGIMTDADAATLVGAGVVSVMLFPQIAAAIGSRSNAQAQPADADDVAPA